MNREDLDLCSRVCGARCCKAPGCLEVFESEVAAFEAAARNAGLTLVWKQGERRHLLDYAENGGACPFLVDNLCSIYEERPEMCRRFPVQPTVGCLMWPGGEA